MDMRVNSVKPYNPSFQARNQTIRFADDLARHVNKNFPLVSSTKLHKFKNGFQRKFSGVHDRVNDKITNSRFLQRDAIMRNSDDMVAFEEFSKVLKTTNAGNCGELSMLTFVMAKMNKIDNAKLVSMKTDTGKHLDHSVVLVQGKKPYIIDAWLGFADYVPNAIQKYKSEFSENFDRRLLKSRNLKFATRDSIQDFTFNNLVGDTFTIYKLKKSHPEWILPNQNKPQPNLQQLKEKSVKAFFDLIDRLQQG